MVVNMSFNFLKSKKKVEQKKESDSSYYGGDSDSGSEGESSSYYGSSDETDDKPSKTKAHTNTPLGSGKRYFGFLWWELVIILIELMLLTYTLMVYLGLAKLF